MEAEKRGKRKLKKDFIKNKYKYVPGNQQEGQGFANKLKEKFYHDYKKLKRRDRTAGFDVHKIYEELNNSDEEAKPTVKQKASSRTTRFEEKKQVSKFSKAQWEYQKKAEQKQKKAEEAVRKKKEKEEALAKYKEKKKHRFLKLCKRTSRGQPILNNQVHLMLEKLQKQREAESQTSASSS